MLKARLLGQFAIHLDDEPVEIRSRPTQSLLAYLLLHAGQAQRRERLAGLFWPDSSESNARNNLRCALWRIRQGIGGAYIQSNKVWVTFDADADYWLDAAVLQSEPGEEPSADDLMTCFSVYSGELLPGFYDEWGAWERELLHAVYEERMALLLERLVAEGR